MLRQTVSSQNELSSPIAANFCPTFFGLDFHFYVIFLLIGIGQLDNDVLKKCSSKNINSFSLTKSIIEFECELRYCDEVYMYILISYKTEIFKSFYSIHLYMDLLLIK